MMVAGSRVGTPLPGAATMHLPHETALIVIDVQQGFDHPRWGRRNNPDAEANVARLIAAWRASERQIYHVQLISTDDTSPLQPQFPGFQFKPEAKPLWHEPVITKRVNSAFIGTDLEERLRQRRIRTLVICGLTTNHCVETTARMAGNLGYDTYLAGDACAAFDRTGPDGVTYPAEQVHAISLANIHGEFATVLTTDQILTALRVPEP
jgi:nicotinamidase-related amidase